MNHTSLSIIKSHKFEEVNEIKMLIKMEFTAKFDLNYRIALVYIYIS